MLIKAKKVDLHTCAFVSLSEHFYLYLIKYGYHSCSLVRIVYDKFLVFPGYTKNFYRKDDEILVFHAAEVPSLPATPYPCKVL